MTIRSLLVLALLLVSACATQRDASQDDAAAAEGTSEPIFRYAQFVEDWTVRLGHPLDPPVHALESGAFRREASGVYKLSFAYNYDYGDVPIVVTIHTGPDDVVDSLRFDYGSGYDFAAELAHYIETLGEPGRHDASSEGEVVVWEDERTRFELVRSASAGGERYYSQLSER